MAASNMKAIKRRIKSVESTMQITKAMELVSSSKLRKAKAELENTRPYFNMIETEIRRIFQSKKNTYYHLTYLKFYNF